MIELHFEQLNHRSDYRETSLLIYKTDPYIYKDLFGTPENACNILQYSFDNPSCVFYKQSIYVVKSSRDDVIGCVLNHNNGCHWNSDDILADFEKAGVDPEPSFFAAAEYMDKTYNYRKLGKSICNVSVHDDYKRLGVASFLLKNLFEREWRDIFELTVLADNIAAIKLYEKFGFKIVGNAFEDYGGYNLPPVMCYKMVYNGAKITL